MDILSCLAYGLYNLLKSFDLLHWSYDLMPLWPCNHFHIAFRDWHTCAFSRFNNVCLWWWNRLYIYTEWCFISRKSDQEVERYVERDGRGPSESVHAQGEGRRLVCLSEARGWHFLCAWHQRGWLPCWWAWARICLGMAPVMARRRGELVPTWLVHRLYKKGHSEWHCDCLGASAVAVHLVWCWHAAMLQEPDETLQAWKNQNNI